MAEDQGVNGDNWTKEASLLLDKFGWEQIGDNNIDIEGFSGTDVGLDAIFKFKDSHRAVEQAILFEAKRYNTSSFSKTNFESWINILDKKITELRFSPHFHEMFPILDDCELNCGLIAIWFHDYENYFGFKNKLKSIFTEIKTSSRHRNVGYSKIFVITNDEILKLCSVYGQIEKIKTENGSKVLYYYPSSDVLNVPIKKTKILSLDYMFSKFILCESIIQSEIKRKIVFYFGDRDMKSMQRLRSALLKLSFIEEDCPLFIYFYNEDTEYRKIENQVKEMFDVSDFQIFNMTRFSNLPDWIQNNI